MQQDLRDRLPEGVKLARYSLHPTRGVRLINPRLFDLERIEVVKGPQNALSF